MLRIVLTGPESSGKTTLAKTLAEHYQTLWVPEYARDYLKSKELNYNFEDLEQIAKGQLALEDACAIKANRLIFCDTALFVMKVWSEYRFGKCAPWILNQLQERTYHLYLLCSPDISWEYDPLRQNADNRNELFQIYEKELKAYQQQFIYLEGDLSKRCQKAIETIDTLLKNRE